MRRDHDNEAALHAKGWKTEIVWECETKSRETLRARLDRIFGPVGSKDAP